MKTKAEIIQEVIKGEGLETTEIMIEKALSIQEKEFLEMIESKIKPEFIMEIETEKDAKEFIRKLKSAVEGRK